MIRRRTRIRWPERPPEPILAGWADFARTATARTRCISGWSPTTYEKVRRSTPCRSPRFSSLRAARRLGIFDELDGWWREDDDVFEKMGARAPGDQRAGGHALCGRGGACACPEPFGAED